MTTDITKLARAIAEIDDPEIIALVLEATLPRVEADRIVPAPQRARRRKVATAQSYRRWDADEIATLRLLIDSKLTTSQIARKMGRSQKSITHAINKFTRA